MLNRLILMITNKHRNLYKEITINEKNKKETKTDEYLDNLTIIEELIEWGYLVLIDNVYKTTNNKLPRKQREKAYKKIKKIKGKIQIPILRCEKPKFSGRGRKWESFNQNINNIVTEFHVDVNWGNYIYFSAEDDRWYKIAVEYQYDYESENGIDIQTEIDELLNNHDQKYELKF